jgi:2'-5' RNA ligase
MYGVVMHFDRETERFVEDLWAGLSTEEISTYAEEVEDRRPHITIADYQDVSIETLTSSMTTFFNRMPPVELDLSVLGAFMGSGTLFMTPTPAKDLIDLHYRFHEYFRKFNHDPQSFYLPNRWIPHCTIANRLSHEKLVEAFDYCLQRKRDAIAKVTEVALIQPIYDGDKCVRSPAIFTVQLR